MTIYAHAIFKGFWQGFIAITANTIVLKAAPLFHIISESGGLLKLLVIHTHDYLSQGVLSYFKTPMFWLLFHYATGFSMVLIYSYLFKPLLPGKGWIKGSLFSLFPWMLNGLIVLPLLGQGIFGVKQLSMPGMVYFFISNWIFGLILGLLF